jgi:tetratricopeptide (TPR) repeat protein
MHALPPLSEKDGITLMQNLGYGELSNDLLKQAYDRVAGHPKFLTMLAGLSKLFPLSALLNELPHVPDKVYEHIQNKVYDSLESDAKRLLQKLSILEIPFRVSVVHQLIKHPDGYMAFDKLVNRFLVTRINQQSDYYDIHDLVREFSRKQVPVEELGTIHKELSAYYQSLSKKIYLESRMGIYHALEGGLLDEACEALRILLRSALYEGMYEYILQYTSSLLKDERVNVWGFVHHLRGRMFRFKQDYAKARDAYKAALNFALNTFDLEQAKFELGSVLVLLSDKTGKKETEQAKKYFLELKESFTPEIRLQAINALGTISLREQDSSCLQEMMDAASEAEQLGLWINVFQLCICIGQAFIKFSDNLSQAIHYLERALQIQLEHRKDLGAENPEAIYITHLELAKLYSQVGRHTDEVEAWQVCVALDYRLGLIERLAESLNYLGRAQLKIGNNKGAQESFTESTGLISKYRLLGKAKVVHLEWLTVTFWDLGDYEKALECSMEAAYICEQQLIDPNPLPITLEKDAPSHVEVLKARKRGVILLVLPSKYDFSNIAMWVKKIVQRRPELKTVTMVDLNKEGQSVPPDGASNMNKIGRNAPCPCGSGKKFKKCCGI